MPEFDVDYQRRAEKLVKEAKKKAYSGWKISPAARAYFTSETAGRVFGAAAGSVVIGTIAQACAGAAVSAGLVGVSAATFGLGPAVGVVLTYAFLKGLAEAKYQSKNDSLKKGVVRIDDQDGDGPYLAIGDPSLLGPLIAKVLKKYERVQRAAAQAGAYGTWEHIKSSTRHAKTAFRGLRKDLGWAKTQSELFPGLAYDDHELSDRLYELRFYAQMLFNYVEWITDHVAVTKRNQVADACQILYGHVLRQVHVTGNHEHCNKCYNMPPAQFQARLREVAPGPESLAADFGAKDRSAFLAGLGADKRPAAGQLRQNLAAMQQQGPMRIRERHAGPGGGKVVERQPKPTWNDAIARGMFRGAVSAKGVVAGVQFINQEAGEALNMGVHASFANATQVADKVGQAAGQGAQGAAQTAGVGVAAAELARTISNRLTRRSVLKPERLRGAFNLLAESGEARAEAFLEFRRLIAKHDVIGRAPRIGEKIVWYIEKLTKIQADFNRAYEPVLRKGADYGESAFTTCDDAYALVYNANYFFRNCEKFIAFLVYLEVILLEIDQNVSKIPKIGIGRGAIVRPGQKTPPQPLTVKGFGADWDKQKSVLPWR
jgi:hypothetical protein